MTMFAKTITAALVSLSLGIGALGATPARADGEDVAKALLGLGVLLAIANELDDDDKKKRRVDQSYNWREERLSRYRWAKLLPPQCIRTVDTRNNGWRKHKQDKHDGYRHRGHDDGRQLTVVLGKCVRKSGHARKLPESCKADRISRRLDTPAYRLRCLRDKGFVVARHR